MLSTKTSWTKARENSPLGALVQGNWNAHAAPRFGWKNSKEEQADLSMGVLGKMRSDSYGTGVPSALDEKRGIASWDILRLHWDFESLVQRSHHNGKGVSRLGRC